MAAGAVFHSIAFTLSAAVTRGYRPLNTGTRFSTKAFAASA